MLKTGMVYLVGAGPGDPGLMTLKGAECLARADVIVYDHLLNEELLGMTPAGAERIYAGKTSSRHTLEQDEINKLLVGKARQGKTVVRLKGGDSFVFGRGGRKPKPWPNSASPTKSCRGCRPPLRHRPTPGYPSPIAKWPHPSR